MADPVRDSCRWAYRQQPKSKRGGVEWAFLLVNVDKMEDAKFFFDFNYSTYTGREGSYELRRLGIWDLSENKITSHREG